MRARNVLVIAALATVLLALFLAVLAADAEAKIISPLPTPTLSTAPSDLPGDMPSMSSMEEDRQERPTAVTIFLPETGAGDDWMMFCVIGLVVLAIIGLIGTGLLSLTALGVRPFPKNWRIRRIGKKNDS